MKCPTSISHLSTTTQISYRSLNLCYFLPQRPHGLLLDPFVNNDYDWFSTSWTVSKDHSVTWPYKREHLAQLSSTPTMINATLIAALVSLAYAATGTPPTGGSSPLSLGTLDSLLKEAISLPNGIIGTIYIVFGLFICLSGKRFFKVFLAVVGALAGGFCGFHVDVWIANIPNFISAETDISLYIIVASAVLGSALSLWFWKAGVYAAGGLGGYSLMAFILSLKAGGLIENAIGKQAALALSTAAGVLAGIFLDEIATIVASAISGAFVTVFGLDFFLATGFRFQVYSAVLPGGAVVDGTTISIAELPQNTIYMMAGMVALSVCGVVAQLLKPSKGYGRE